MRNGYRFAKFFSTVRNIPHDFNGLRKGVASRQRKSIHTCLIAPEIDLALPEYVLSTSFIAVR